MKNRRLFAHAALLLFAQIAPGHAYAAGSDGAVSGSVTDSSGKPVANASVTIQTSDGLHPHATRTDAEGHFQFTRWETGQYDLRAYSDGVFSEWQRRIMIHSKKPTRITLRLPDAK